MANYIDVDKTILNFGFEWDDISPTLDEFINFLNRQKVVDAVEVVRCKDCIHSEEWGGPYNDYWCYYEEEHMPPNHYCGYGKVKE